jgi:hypothetical protein
MRFLRGTDSIINFDNFLVTSQPRVEAPTVIPASRKKRRKGKPVVPDEAGMYGYESSGTLKDG